jgi:DNA polymerase-3 subunit gamma/tau
MSYVALYRKYKPKNFYDIVGQNIIIETLKNAIKYNKIHHCYLFSGEKGIGKTTLAKILAKNINCFNLKEYDCCNQCDSCCLIEKKQNLDIIEIDGAFYNGIDEIKELQNQVQYKPSFFKYKIYIIDEIHVLSSSAFNALLKLLEEPPKNIIFILITSEIQKIPKTIISRTQHFHLQNISSKNIKNKLINITQKEKVFIKDEALEKISLYANGSLRDALNLLDQISAYKTGLIEVKDIEEILGIISEEKINRLSLYLLKKETINIIFFLEEIFEKNNINTSLLVDDLIDFFQKKIIDFFRNKNNKENLFFNLNFQKREKFFEILFRLKQNLIYSKQKQNLVITSLLEMNQLFLNNEISSNNKGKESKEKNDFVYLPQKSFFNFNFTKKKKITEENKEKFNLISLSEKKQKNILINNSTSVNKKIITQTKKENNFIIQRLKKFFLYSDEKTKNFILKGWSKLEKFPKKDLAIPASFLYKTKLLIITYDKEMLISCENFNDYKQLLTNYIRNKIKLILNSKKKLIEDYFVILKKDWEEILNIIYLKFKKSKDHNDLDFTNFNTLFYEQNSILNIEQNQSIIVKLARDFFGFDKVNIIDSDEIRSENDIY